MSRSIRNANRIVEGDVIQFFDHVRNDEGPSNQARFGLVVSVVNDDENIFGFQVLEFVRKNKEEYIKPNPRNQVLLLEYRDGEYYQRMGLDKNFNYLMLYQTVGVLNRPEHLGHKEQGMVIHNGDLTYGSPLANEIAGAAARKNIYQDLTGLTEHQARQVSGMQANTTMQMIEQYRIAEKGVDVRRQRAAQDGEDAEALYLEEQAKKAQRPRRKRLVHETDISISDAVKTGILRPQTQDLIAQKLPKATHLMEVVRAAAENSDILTLKTPAFTLDKETVAQVRAHLDTPEGKADLKRLATPENIRRQFSEMNALRTTHGRTLLRKQVNEDKLSMETVETIRKALDEIGQLNAILSSTKDADLLSASVQKVRDAAFSGKGMRAVLKVTDQSDTQKMHEELKTLESRHGKTKIVNAGLESYTIEVISKILEEKHLRELEASADSGVVDAEDDFDYLADVEKAREFFMNNPDDDRFDDVEKTHDVYL